jgi:hypothetical protein
MHSAQKAPFSLLKQRLGYFAPVALLAIVLLATPAHADVTVTDLQVAARALSFVSDPLKGTVKVGILYTKDSARSLRQAESTERLLAGGFRIGAMVLSPVLVELNEATTAKVDVFFLTEYVAPDAVPRLTGGRAMRALCITTDIEQVRKGTCTIGVRSRPKVEVFVNRAAAKANGVAFSTVFRVMITEI